jgi:hypothetical protein
MPVSLRTRVRVHVHVRVMATAKATTLDPPGKPSTISGVMVP